jgi:flagella basal body P-ring formation protein FlgA
MRVILFILFSIQLCAQSFEQNVLQYLQKRFTGYEKIEINVQDKIEENEKLTIDKSKEPNQGRGFILIPVFIEKNNFKKQSFVTIKVRLFKKVLISNGDIKSRETLAQNLFREQLTDVSEFSGTPFTEPDELSKYRTRSFLREGDILFKEKIELEPIINMGDKISAEVKCGNVSITTDAFARQNGNKGDVIRIISNNKILNARVVNHNKVIVE